MKVTYREVLESVKSLRKGERRKLRKELDALDAMTDEEIADEELFQELEKRRRECEADPTLLISSDEAMKYLKEKYS